MGYPWKIDKYQQFRFKQVHTSNSGVRQTKQRRETWFRKKWEEKWKQQKYQGLWNWESKEPGRDRSYHNAGSRGQTYGRWTNLALPSCKDRSTIPYPHQQTFISGDSYMIQHASCAEREEPWLASYLDVQWPCSKGATDVDMIEYREAGRHSWGEQDQEPNNKEKAGNYTFCQRRGLNHNRVQRCAEVIHFRHL